MQKISFVTRNFASGGAERVIQNLIEYFSLKNILCSLLLLEDKPIFYDIPSTIEVIKIGKRSNIKFFDKFLKYLSLRKYINIIDPDIVLAMPEEVGIFTILALFGTKNRIVVSERNNPWVMPKKMMTRLLRSFSYPLASGIIFQTQKSASYFPKKIYEKGTILLNPIDNKKIPECWLGEREKLIIGVGRLVPQKNFSLLIKAFSIFQSHHPSYKLKIYGEGPLRSELFDLCSNFLPKGAFSFPGVTTNLLIEIRKAAMLVISSDYEGLPNIMIEAMAMGLPVISTDCPSGGLKEIIINQKNGLLVPVGDSVCLSNAMCQIADNKKFAKYLSKNALLIKDKLDIQLIGETWEEYLNGICDKIEK